MGTFSGSNNDRLLGKMFLGVLSAPPAMGTAPLEAVVQSATSSSCTVTVNNFDPTGQSTFAASFEPRFGSGSTPQTPPRGTKCLVAFPGNSTSNGPWVVAFLGWPT